MSPFGALAAGENRFALHEFYTCKEKHMHCPVMTGVTQKQLAFARKKHAWPYGGALNMAAAEY